MKPELSPEDIGLYSQSVVTSVETPRAGRNGQLLFRCPIRSEPPHDISMDPGTGKWLCLGGSLGVGDIFDYHAGKFKSFDYRQPEIAVLIIIRDAKKKAQKAEEAARVA